MALVAPYAVFFVLEGLIVPDDAAKTADNIITSEGLFRTGICGLIIVIILDIIVAWSLYVFLKPVNKSLSLLAAWFRLVYAAIFAIASNNLLNVLYLLSGAEYFTVLETNQLHAQVMLNINAFNTGWQIGLIIFSLHLFVLGYLVFKSGYIPKTLGILLIIAALGYLMDGFGKFLLPDYNLTIAAFTFIGEVLLIFWLLIKGVKISERNPEIASLVFDKKQE